jgi:hypothetical protein
MSTLFASLARTDVPVQYLQLDPYWYDGKEWSPRQDLYGDGGLPRLVKALNDTQLLLYHNFWSRYSAQHYALQNQTFTFVPGYSFVSYGTHRTIFQIDPDHAFKFFDYIFGQYMRQGVMIAAEVDFLNWSQLTIPSLFSVLDGGHKYLKGFADAALKYGVSHQLCMAMPSQAMDSLLLPAVTNARASGDNTPTNENRWLIGYTSLLLWPLDVQPFFDNVWSTAHEPAQPYGAGVYRHNVILQMVLTALSAGPIGIADQIGYTNATLVLQTCTSNGTLLQPDKPATPIDAMFSPTAPFRPEGEVWQTHTQLGSGAEEVMWRYVVGIDTSYELHHDQLWPRGHAHDTLVLPWHTRYECNDTRLDTPTGCIIRWDWHDTFSLHTTPMQQELEHGFDMIVVAPIMWSASGKGIALLGELSKIVSVSSSRFAHMALQSNGTLHMELQGAPHEQVYLVYYTFENREDATGARRIRSLVLGECGLISALLG